MLAAAANQGKTTGRHQEVIRGTEHESRLMTTTYGVKSFNPKKLYSMLQLTCYRSFIHPLAEPCDYLRISARVEQSPDGRNFQLAQRGGRLR